MSLSNAPYADQRKFNANANVNNVVGISNSPFTDQRKEGNGGGTGGGNVNYNGLDLSVVNGSKIVNIDNGTDNLTIGGELVEIKVNERFVATSNKEIPGEICGWRNIDSTNTLIGGFKMSRGSGTEELIICDDIDIFSFAGNDSLIPNDITPVIRFNQIVNTDSNIRFMNVPTTINDVLTYTAQSGSVAEVEWRQPIGNGGNVEYNGLDLSVVNGSKIVNIDNGTDNLSFQNAGGGLNLNAFNDDATLRGDSKLSLQSVLGDIEIEATNNISITSGNGPQALSIKQGDQNEITLSDTNATDSSLFIASRGNDPLQNQNLIALQATNGSSDNITMQLFARELGETVLQTGVTNTPLSGNATSMLVQHTGSGMKYFSCQEFFLENSPSDPNSSPLFSFGTNSNGLPEYFRWGFDGSVGDVLTIASGSGGTASPYQLSWTSSSGTGGGNVVSNASTDSLTRDDGTGTQVIIPKIDQKENDFALRNYNDENQITMTKFRPFGSPQDTARIELKSSGLSFDHQILMFTENTEGGNGASIQIESSESTVVSDPTNSIILKVYDIRRNTRNVPFFKVDGNPSGNDALRRFQLSDNEATFGGFEYINFARNVTPSGGTNPNPKYIFRNDTRVYQYINEPVVSTQLNDPILTVRAGNGLDGSPFEMEWVNPPNNLGALDTLDITYNQENSVLVLSDPVDGVISTTTVVGGRTVLIEDVIVNGTTELSALGLSNSIFPPPLEGQAGYFAGLIGNSPPRVSLNPTTGLTNWFVGASFKITMAGEITKIGGYDDIILKVYSNRGQPSENILNSFRMITRTVDPPPKVGWNWVVDFTCRKVNDGGILGVIATSSSFNYTDDTYVLETLGAIVSNTNSSFDTSVEQFLDCTIEFDYYNQSNNIKTTLATIERIY